MIYFVIDDTQVLKRAKKMDAVGRLYHHASGQYGMGHTILKVSLHYRGVTIPWGSWLYVKREHAAQLGLPFVKTTDLAARAIDEARLPAGSPVTVLCDAMYLCPPVVRAAEARGWHYIGAGKQNRRFTVDGRVHYLSTYGPNVLRRSGKWMKIMGLASRQEYHVAERTGLIKKLGQAKVVFSRRRGRRQPLALVTNDLSRPARKVVADYSLRWSVELLIKDEKQHMPA
jgi:hypothetical protein